MGGCLSTSYQRRSGPANQLGQNSPSDSPQAQPYVAEAYTVASFEKYDLIRVSPISDKLSVHLQSNGGAAFEPTPTGYARNSEVREERRLVSYQIGCVSEMKQQASWNSSDIQGQKDKIARFPWRMKQAKEKAQAIRGEIQSQKSKYQKVTEFLTNQRNKISTSSYLIGESQRISQLMKNCLKENTELIDKLRIKKVQAKSRVSELAHQKQQEEQRRRRYFQGPIVGMVPSKFLYHSPHVGFDSLTLNKKQINRPQISLTQSTLQYDLQWALFKVQTPNLNLNEIKSFSKPQPQVNLFWFTHVIAAYFIACLLHAMYS